MNYNQAIQFLYDLRLFGLKFGLENTRTLAALVGNPENQLRFIHVAGTNGKGSTCAMLESIYRAAGLRVGLYTSPHLVSFSERIQVNRIPIATDDVTRLVTELRALPVFSGGDEICPTFFEAVTVMAMKYFAEQRCDLVIWETGLGGRLDATNIVTPLASVITNVQLDHQQWLGETIPDIAREKAGIIKEHVPVVTGAEDAAALQVISETAAVRHAPLHVVTATDVEAMTDFALGLAGEHQRMNAAVARKTVEILVDRIAVPADALRQGLKNTNWAGRHQLAQGGSTLFLLDGAHNPAGAQTLARTLNTEFAGKKATLILGMMKDKDSEAICTILAPLAGKILATRLASERSAEPESLAALCRRFNANADITVCQSIDEALRKSNADPFVVVCGSLYFVGEALERLGLASGSSERELNEYGSAPASRPGIRAVTFDVGGTLIEPFPSVGHVYRDIAARHGVHAGADLLDERFITAWRSRKKFSYTVEEWAELVDQTFHGLSTIRPSETFFSELYQEFAQPAAWRVFEDVRPCLERLRETGLKLAAVSNWDDRLRPLLAALDLEKYFDVVVVSAEIGHHKPASEVFHEAAARLATPAASILHIGDSRREDFDGARAAGFQSLLLTRGQKPTDKNSIESLDQLAPAILPTSVAPSEHSAR